MACVISGVTVVEDKTAKAWSLERVCWGCGESLVSAGKGGVFPSPDWAELGYLMVSALPGQRHQHSVEGRVREHSNVPLGRGSGEGSGGRWNEEG